MKKLSKHLKKMLDGLAFQYAGDYLTTAQKLSILRQFEIFKIPKIAQDFWL